MYEPVENGRLKVILEMCATIMCQFTMESFEIIEESKRSIVPETRFIKNSLFKDSKCVTTNNQSSYCEQDCLRDCSCHGCGGYLCCMYA